MDLERCAKRLHRVQFPVLRSLIFEGDPILAQEIDNDPSELRRWLEAVSSPQAVPEPQELALEPPLRQLSHTQIDVDEGIQILGDYLRTDGVFSQDFSQDLEHAVGVSGHD